MQGFKNKNKKEKGFTIGLGKSFTREKGFIYHKKFYFSL